jgi:hypothetical protein
MSTRKIKVQKRVYRISCMRENKDTYKTLVRKPESKGPFETKAEHYNGSQGNKLDVNWIHPNLDTVQ